MKMLFKQLVLFSVAMICSWSTIAQAKKQVTGIVKDADGAGIPSVTVKEKGTNNQTVTNNTGAFKISVSSNATLVFSSVGFETQEVNVENNSTINVELKSTSKEVGEVVVTALGFKRQKKELGYSTATIKGADLVQSSSPNILNAVSGKVSGVQITQPNGVEGGTTKIIIRGNNTFTGNNQPLVVVDGMPLENAPTMTSISSGKDWGSAINNINPNDIETMDILKGPNAAALYGARGANGVIIITTKKGRKTKGIGLEYSLDHRIIQPYLYRDVQNEYGGGGAGTGDLEPKLPKNSAGKDVLPFFIDWGSGKGYGMGFGSTALGSRASWDLFSWYGPGASWGPKMDGTPVIWWDGKTRNYSPQPGNLKSFFKNGNTTTHNLAFSSGGDFGSVRVSLTRLDHNSVDYNSNAAQNTVNLGSNLNISSKLKASLSVSYINYKRKNATELGESDSRQQSGRESAGKYLLYNYGRDFINIPKDIYQNADGTQNQFWVKPAGADYTSYSEYEAYGYFNDYWWRIYNNNEYLDRNKLLGTINLTYDITPWLSLTGRLASDLTFNQTEQKNKPIDLTGITGGFYSKATATSKVFNNELFLTARKNNIFKNINASLTVGGANWSRDDYSQGASTSDWQYPWAYSLTNIKSTSRLQTSEYVYKKKIRSLYSLLDISYNNYLFLQVTGRNDISSTLPTASNSYFFPSASLSFVATDAIKGLKSDVLSFAKLRVSYATSATDADPYQTQLNFSPGSYNGQLAISLPGIVPPQTLKNSTNRGFEFGISAGFLKDRINFDAAFYSNKASNQIFSAPLPVSSGASSFVFNNGSISNKGIEISIDAAAMQKKDFTWDIGLKLTSNKSKINEIDGKAEFIELQSLWGNYGPSIRLKKGDSYGTIYGYKVQRNSKGEKIVSADGTRYLTDNNKVPMGNTTPKMLIGLTNRFQYKNFVLSTLVDMKIGGDMFSGTYVYSILAGQDPSTLKERNGGGLPYTDASGKTRNVGVIMEGAKEDGSKNTQVVHYLWKYMGNVGSGWGDWSLPNGKRYFFNHEAGVFENTYVKMREISLAYQVPAKVISKTKIFQTLNVYFTGRDLFYLYKTAPSNINPEGTNGASNAEGFEWGALPGMRSFSFGIKAAF